MTAVDHLSRATLETAPPPCRTCMWWQQSDASARDRFIDQIEDDFGPWGKLYRDGDRVIGLIQYGPATCFPRARSLPAGPPGRDAVLVTCAYLTDANSPWVLQSLFLAAIGECRDRGLPALETFAYRYREDAGFPARFLHHRTIFPADFLRDFGFHTHRGSGRIELMRLDLRAIETTAERSRFDRLRERLAVVNPMPAVHPLHPVDRR
ncbi:MAG TPA: hypothetical protein VMU66_05690 [Gaiellales bacterium]|nr:hypothetical protein [Gaiellales bacterium]